LLTATGEWIYKVVSSGGEGINKKSLTKPERIVKIKNTLFFGKLNSDVVQVSEKKKGQ